MFVLKEIHFNNNTLCICDHCHGVGVINSHYLDLKIGVLCSKDEIISYRRFLGGRLPLPMENTLVLGRWKQTFCVPYSDCLLFQCLEWVNVGIYFMGKL